MSKRIKSLLFASMIGFASAIELAKKAKYEYTWRQSAEFLHQKRQIAKKVTYYSGPISKLMPYHLDNTGSLVKAYRPKLFVPSTNLVEISNITPEYELKSDFFRIYKFGNPDIILPGSDKILLPGNKKINQVIPLFNNFDQQTSNYVIDKYATHILNLTAP